MGAPFSERERERERGGGGMTEVRREMGLDGVEESEISAGIESRGSQ